MVGKPLIYHNNKFIITEYIFLGWIKKALNHKLITIKLN